MSQDVRAIDWHSERTDSVVRKIRAAEGHPGVLDEIGGTRVPSLRRPPRARRCAAAPGEIIAQRNGAICRATVDGAVWITHLRRRDTPAETFFKLPATRALALAGRELDAPEVPVAIDAPLPRGAHLPRDRL